MKDVEQRVHDLLSAFFQLPAGAVAHLSPDTVDGWDSLKHLDLVLALEEEFGVQFTVDEISSMQNASNIVAVVRAHTNPA